MKRLTLFITSIVLLIFLCGTNTFMQQRMNQSELKPEDDATANSYISSSSRHKLILSSEDSSIYDDLIGKGAVVERIDYGSFSLVIVDEEAAGGRAAFKALRVPVRDDQNLILFNNYVLDSSNPEASYVKLPGDLRQTDMIEATARGSQPHGGLYIVQFVGPILDKWIEALNSTGAEIVTYMASNAYIVRASASAAQALIQLKNKHSFVQFLGNYEPAYRISPQVQAMRNGSANTLVNVTVQVIAGSGAKYTINKLRVLASKFLGSHRVLNYHDVQLEVQAGQLTDIATMDNVFAVEEFGTLERADEAQGQILAGNLSGNVPVGPGYLSFLGSVGFSSTQFGSFAVNVVDDAYSLTGHPDLPSSRIAFQNNPSGQTGPQGGHGFLNAQIVGGFNNGTGSAVEDSNGFNYGLGIAPFARVGVTAIFGSPFPTSSVAWENTAYGQGARISTNSWVLSNIFNYDTRAQEYDSIVRDAQGGTPGLQQMIEVCGAGNDGPTGGTIHSPATAKNVITVGAGESVRQSGTDGCGFGNALADSANDVANFSSRGPVNALTDGRTKPDILAPGTHIVAGVPQSNYDGHSVCNQYFPPGQMLYGMSSGTSQATPAIAGAAALVYQSFINSGLPVPSPAMVKAYLMNSASYMTGAGGNDTLPSNSQGMGRMNLIPAFNGQARLFYDQHLALSNTGQTFQVSGSVHVGSRPLRITLAWTDAPGPTTGQPYVNNLDLEVSINGTTYRGNFFSGANSVSGGTADTRNNVESVFLPAGTVGNFTVTVRATNIAGDGVPGNGDPTDQDFALLISNAISSMSLNSNSEFEDGSLTETLSEHAIYTGIEGFPMPEDSDNANGSCFQQDRMRIESCTGFGCWLDAISSEINRASQLERFFIKSHNPWERWLSELAPLINPSC